MAFDRGLEERLYDYFEGHQGLTVKKMFGGLCFSLSEHVCCVIMGDQLMARVGLVNYTDCLAKPYVSEMNFTGKSIKGWLFVAPDGFESDSDLEYWVNMCVTFVDSLPPKQTKRAKKKKAF